MKVLKKECEFDPGSEGRLKTYLTHASKSAGVSLLAKPMT